MGQSYTIRVSSQKGGVGKTTIAVNIAAVLSYFKYKVILVDADLSSPAVGEHFGLRNPSVGYVDVLRGDANLESAMFLYQQTNLRIVTGRVSKDAYNPTSERMVKDFGAFHSALKKTDSDFIILDSPPGPVEDDLVRFFDEAVLVGTPEMIAIEGSATFAAQCDRHKLKHRFIINRKGYTDYEMDIGEIEKIYGDVVDAIIPEDKTIEKSIARHQPAYIMDRGSEFANAIEQFSRVYMLRAGEKPEERGEEPSKSIFGSFGKMLKLK